MRLTTNCSIFFFIISLAVISLTCRTYYIEIHENHISQWLCLVTWMLIMTMISDSRMLKPRYLQRKIFSSLNERNHNEVALFSSKITLRSWGQQEAHRFDLSNSSTRLLPHVTDATDIESIGVPASTPSNCVPYIHLHARSLWQEH